MRTCCTEANEQNHKAAGRLNVWHKKAVTVVHCAWPLIWRFKGKRIEIPTL